MVRGSTWFLKNSNLSPGVADISFAYGYGSDLPVAGDWDGDGRWTPGVVRGTTWHLRATNDPADPATVPPFAYGGTTDQPLAGDWDGNRTTTIGVKRGGTWLLRNHNSADGVDLTINYGLGCDLGFAAPGAIGRDRGGKGLPASLQGRELTRLATTSKLIALTFDAGANADGVPSILDTLQRTCTPATFFLTGGWADQFQGQARQITTRHPVGTTPGTILTCRHSRTRPSETSSSGPSRRCREQPNISLGRCSASPSGTATPAPWRS